jgi:hypothetical protein
MSAIAQWLIDLMNALVRFAWQHGQQFPGLAATRLSRLGEWLGRMR